ncbi:hypothetical protein FNJ47_48880, partial [Bradyrhizobium sp. UFLA 03-164]|nr:hypothetical protein [Bradyrhizobium uaiense]
FDRDCFAANGASFESDIVAAANQPLKCGRSAGEYRAYLPRARRNRGSQTPPDAHRRRSCGQPADCGR